MSDFWRFEVERGMEGLLHGYVVSLEVRKLFCKEAMIAQHCESTKHY